MNKVTVEITPDKYKIVVNLGGKEFVEEHEITDGGARQISEKSFEDMEEIPEELYDALNSFFAYDVMEALNEMDWE